MLSLNDIPKLTSVNNNGADVAAAYLDNFFEEYRENGELDLDPDFQRGHVWTAEQQTKYIEHRLRGGRSGNIIYWNQSRYLQPIQIVDGKQRLTAVRMFLNDEVTVFGGNKFSDYDDLAQRSMISITGSLSLRMEINDLQTRAEVLNWYLELNEGAVAHTPEELARVRGLLADAK